MVKFNSLLSLGLLVLSAVSGQTAEYDYIVVGGGTGGGTLAVELAMKGYKTLIVEAGPDNYDVINSIPAFHPKASEYKPISFDYDVAHYDNDSKRYFYPRVGGLGGCSIHNAMISVYPNTRDFKLMTDITGDDSWSETNMRKYFRRMENNQYSLGLLKDDHGFDGWFFTSYLDFLKQIKIELLDFPLIDLARSVLGNIFIDVNGKTGNLLNSDREGRIFVPQAVNKEDFTRVNFPKYIKDAAKKYPLTIMTDTLVTKVIIDSTKTARGVEFKKGKYLYKASPMSTDQNRANAVAGKIYAKREVIVSAGAFNTPQILMLSGIGEPAQLTKFKIPIVSNVPGVGRNLMDRYEIPHVLRYPKNFTLVEACKFTPTSDDTCYQEYEKSRTGPYISNGILAGELKKSNDDLNEPDVFLLNSLSDFHGYIRGYSLDIPKRLDSFTRLILKAHTSNTNGQVSLKSSDPFDTPEINFRYFSDGDDDLNILIQEVKDQRKFLKTIIAEHREIYPGPEVQTDAQIKKFIKDIAWGHHASCTAKIGKDNDPLAVLDAKFRVRGVKGLRVVDASAFPRIPGYFPVVYLHMMAMKAADIITA